jgi:hypothetical protein
MTDDDETEREPVQCEHPYCEKALLDGRHTYVGEHGNELVLCGTHYYELVADESAKPRRSSTSVLSGDSIPETTTSPRPRFQRGLDRD